jgi:hypothetical protein
MKKRITPQEKKNIAYEKDHYVSAGESRHAFRKNWPKKKAMLNQKHRHRAGQLLHEIEKLGNFESIESSDTVVTADQLRKIDPREKLNKWGVKSLREYVEQNQEHREKGASRKQRYQEQIKARYVAFIAALERDPDSREAQELLREISYGGWHLRLFLKDNPEWRPRLRAKLVEINRLEVKAKLKREKKESEKRRVKKLKSALQRQIKVR